MDVRLPDGTTITNVPDNITQADLMARLGKSQQPQEASTADKIAAFPLTRFAVGAAKPFLGAAQAVANLTPYGGAVNEHLATLEDMTNRGADTKWGMGGGVADFAGQVMSPVNLGIAKLIPGGGSALALGGKGAAIGAAGAATAPVLDRKSQGNFWETKAADTALGAVTGGVATPILGKLGEAIIRRLPKGEIDLARNSLQTDQILTKALNDLGQRIEDIPKAQYQQIRQQVNEALRSGKALDAAALLRKTDFDALGIPSLSGQITRDATQFAKERNLRGLAGVGEPLLQRMETQNQALQSGVGGFARGASDNVTAGERLTSALKSTDEGMRKAVSTAYTTARQSTGKDLEVPLQGVAQDMVDIAKRYGGNFPSGIRNMLDDYGIFDGKQTKVFSMQDAEDILQQANKLRGNDPATNSALGEIGASLKKALLGVEVTGGPFAEPRNLAAQRFKLHDLVPALEAASKDTVSADQFMRKYVIAAPTKDVRALAETLRQTSPEALQEARGQIGQQLQRAAFGENVAGDKLFTPERYAKALREIGDQKLSAFFSPQEIDQMKRLSRVGAYINSVPSAAPVSSSNSNIASMLANYGSKLPVVGPAVTLAKAAAGPILNQRTVNTAVASKIPVENAPISPEMRAKLIRALGVGAAGIGVGMAGIQP